MIRHRRDENDEHEACHRDAGSMIPDMLQERPAIPVQAQRPDRRHEQPEKEIPAKVESGPELRSEAEEEEVNPLLCAHLARLEESVKPMHREQREELRKELLVTELSQPWTAEGEEEAPDCGRHTAEPETIA